MKRDAVQIFNDLLNLNADEWNILLSEELNLPINTIKELILARELKIDPKQVKIKVDKALIIESGIKQREEDKKLKKELTESINKELSYRPTTIDKYIVTLRDEEELVSSIICTGKIVIGLDFSKAQLSDSYFCHCIFYNCNFSKTSLESSIINSCVFNNCVFDGADLTSSTLSRTKFIECSMKKATFDYIVMTDNAILVSDFSHSSFIQSKILFSGFSDCKGDKTDWKDVDFVQLAISNANFTNSDFKRAKMAEAILIRVDFTGCDFNSFTTGAITVTNCNYDKKYNDFFELSDVYFSPSVFEWESIPNDDDIDE